jgi:hypothetical protein
VLSVHRAAYTASPLPDALVSADEEIQTTQGASVESIAIEGQ